MLQVLTAATYSHIIVESQISYAVRNIFTKFPYLRYLYHTVISYNSYMYMHVVTFSIVHAGGGELMRKGLGNEADVIHHTSIILSK